MTTTPTINDASGIISPAMVVFRDRLLANIDAMIRIAGDPSRLRPHCKTHKTREVVELQIERGITRHKCATFAEAQMLVEAGVADICLAYNLVGPNIDRAVTFRTTYPDVVFSATADHADPIRELGAAMSAAGTDIGLLLDIDTGQHRTGVCVGDKAEGLYRLIAETDGVTPAGFHVYDGHQHQEDRDERREAVDREFNRVVSFRDQLVAQGLDVPCMVAGGTASFPIYAEKSDPTIQLSPGTCVYNDGGYGSYFPDMVFPPAAAVLTRVVSRPTDDRITLDLGYKAIASDPPMGNRVHFPDLPDAKQVLQNEEHLVLQTERAGEYSPGDVLLGIPWHVCPTSALHRQVFVIDGGELVDRWDVASRDRWITI